MRLQNRGPSFLWEVRGDFPVEEIFKVSFLCGSSKESACSAGDLGLVPGLGRSPGEVKGTHSSILAWRIPWTQSMGSQKVGYH